MLRRGGEPITGARLRAALLRRTRRVAATLLPPAPPPADIPAWDGADRLRRPAREIGRVVFCKPPDAEWGGSGKLKASFFLPPFCAVLARHGLGAYFVQDAEALARAVCRNTAVIFVYNEELHLPARRAGVEHLRGPAFARACAGALVFNAPDQGWMLGDKRATALRMAAHGIPVPEEVTRADGPVFSRAVLGTGQDTAILPPGRPLDPERFNTRLIDTRIAHDGRRWYSALRLMCVGRHVLHISARARDTADGDGSVHNYDMPDDHGVIGAAHAALVAGREADLAALGARLADALGPGFFHHDIVRDAGSGAFYVCESGYKFNHFADVRNRFGPLPLAVTGVDHGYIRTPMWGRRAALAFVAEARRLGMWIPPEAPGPG